VGNPERFKAVAIYQVCEKNFRQRRLSNSRDTRDDAVMRFLQQNTRTIKTRILYIPAKADSDPLKMRL